MNYTLFELARCRARIDPPAMDKFMTDMLTPECDKAIVLLREGLLRKESDCHLKDDDVIHEWLVKRRREIAIASITPEQIHNEVVLAREQRQEGAARKFV